MTSRQSLLDAIARLEAQRDMLGPEIVETALRALQQQLESLGDRGAALEGPRPAEPRTVGLLVADLAPSAHLGGAAGSEVRRRELARLRGLVGEAAGMYGGTLEPFSGEGILAVFGLPLPTGKAAENAVRAALASQVSVEALNRERERDGLPRLSVRLGIHTGVLPGGPRLPGGLLAADPVVSAASRMQEAAPPGGILLSGEACREAGDAFNYAPAGSIPVHGLSEPIQAFRVTGVRPRIFRFRPRGIEGVETPMVGRDAQLESLQSVYGRVLAERCLYAVLISGDGGIGKSRLVDEFLQWLHQRSEDVVLFRGFTEGAGRSVPYSLVRDLFCFRFEIPEDDPIAAQRKLEEGLVATLGHRGRDAASALGDLLGFKSGRTSPGALPPSDAQQVRDRAFQAANEFITAATRLGDTLALVLEDLHWADEGSLDLLRQLCVECRRCPILLVATARPAFLETHPRWLPELVPASRIDLAPLSQPETRILTREILKKAPGIPEEVLDRIARQSEGYPFYLEEFVRTLLEEGVILKGPGTWTVSLPRLAEGGVPLTLMEVLRARLNTLPRAEREALQTAAIVGPVFWDGALASLEGLPESAVEEGGPLASLLRSLAMKGLIQERPGSSFAGTREFEFQHALMYEAAYEGVPEDMRQKQHEAAAAWLEGMAGKRLEHFSGLLAEHYERAGCPFNAAHWYERAGRYARATFAQAAAVSFLGKALSLSPSDGKDPVGQRRADLEWELGEAFLLLARYEDAAEAFLRMRHHAEGRGDLPNQARAWLSLSVVQDRRADFTQSLESARKAEALARQAAAEPELARALFREGCALFRLGDAAAVRTAAEESLDLARRLGLRRDIAFGLKLLGLAHIQEGRFEEARKCQEEALALFRDLSDRWGEANLLNNLGENARTRGDGWKALEIYQEEMRILKETGNRDGEMVCLNNLGAVRVALGEYGQAEKDLRSSIEIAGSRPFTLSESHRFLAEALLGQGRVKEAHAEGRRALDKALEDDYPEALGGAWLTLGRLAARAGAKQRGKGDAPVPPAEECFRQSAAAYGRASSPANRARALREWGLFEIASGRADSGREHLREAFEIFGRIGMRQEAERTSALAPGGGLG